MPGHRPVGTLTRMVEVLTVDDQAVFRAVAREVIDATPGFATAGEAGSGPEALELIHDTRGIAWRSSTFGCPAWTAWRRRVG